MDNFFLQYLSQFHYPGFYLLLLLCGMGLPIPEDLVILVGGYFAYLGEFHLPTTILVLYLGAISGDFALYWIGRRFGKDIIAHKRLTWFFTPHRIKAINYYFHRYGNRTLFFARFLVGLRSTIFLSSGAFRISFWKVLLFNGIAASITVPLVTFLGYHFGSQFDQLVHWMQKVEHILVFAVGIIIGIVIVVIHRIIQKKTAEFEAESSEIRVLANEIAKAEEEPISKP